MTKFFYGHHGLTRPGDFLIGRWNSIQHRKKAPQQSQMSFPAFGKDGNNDGKIFRHWHILLISAEGLPCWKHPIDLGYGKVHEYTPTFLNIGL